MNIRVPKDIREAIILESTKLFLANGFRGTSVQEITKAAGIARGTLYWYFGSKDEILVTIFRKFEAEFLGGLIEEVGNCNGNFETKYRAFIKYATEYARDNRNLSVAFATLLGETVGSNTEAETVVRAIYERYLHFVEGMLEEGKKEGTVGAEVDSAVYAHIIIACNQGMLLEWFIFEKFLDARAFVGKMRDILLKGIMER
jgi:AcrR family transcriptional regulator